MYLLLSYLEFEGINDTDYFGQSSAFIAAKFGHDQTLKCLLDNGTDWTFKIKYNYSDDFSNADIANDIHLRKKSGIHIVDMCKYAYFCGYNIMHIAAQYGHKQVVKMLINRHEELLQSENDMHLNALHLTKYKVKGYISTHYS